jgi:hypothetical protein
MLISLQIMPRVLSIIILFFLLLPSSGFAQKFLVFGKPGKANRMIFNLGSPISFRLQGEGIHIDGFISEIRDSSIVVNGEDFPISRIDRIVDHHKWLKFRSLSKSAFISAGTSLTLSSLHNIINLGKPPVDKPTLTVASSMVLVGLLFSPFKVKKYKVKGMRMIRIVDIPLASN